MRDAGLRRDNTGFRKGVRKQKALYFTTVPGHGTRFYISQ
jgi:hypothetical protein